MSIKKYLFNGLLSAMVLFGIVACNDTLDQVGFTIQPDGDRLSLSTDTLLLSAHSVKVDSIYLSSQYPVLGEYADPVFGHMKADYAGEFYLPETISFKDGAVIDSVSLQISYASIVGDSLAPMRLSVYELNRTLPANKTYSNVEASAYADLSAPIGSARFTGKNATYTTEQYQSGYTTQTVTIYQINVDLPKTMGEEFLAEYLKPGHGSVANQEAFRKFFPGVYVTTDFGGSTMLNVNMTSLYFHYHYLDKNGSSTKTDTIRTARTRLNITPEVTQLNYVQNLNNGTYNASIDKSYVKSPAGVFTEIEMPISQLNEKLKNRALNLANFSVSADPKAFENEQVKLSPPKYLLLINKEDLNGFFEKRSLPNNITSFVGAFNASTYSYDFGNIASMINYYNEKNNGAPFDLTYYLIPVDAEYSSDTSSSSQSLTAITHQSMPTGVVLNTEKGGLKLEVIFSSF